MSGALPPQFIIIIVGLSSTLWGSSKLLPLCIMANTISQPQAAQATTDTLLSSRSREDCTKSVCLQLDPANSLPAKWEAKHVADPVTKQLRGTNRDGDGHTTRELELLTDRLLPTEYAFKAITAANIMAIGVRGKDCAVVLSQKKVPVCRNLNEPLVGSLKLTGVRPG